MHKTALTVSCPDTSHLTQEARSRSGTARVLMMIRIIPSAYQRELRAGKVVAVRRGMPGAVGTAALGQQAQKHSGEWIKW